MRPQKLNLAFTPTRIDEIDFNGEKILIKRDDLTELIASGNKIRKLEYFFFQAKEQKCKKVVTCGGIQSNHARATAYLARKLGFEPVLFLRGNAEKPYDGNLLLDYLFDSEIHFVTEEEYEEIEKIMEEYKIKNEEKGEKVLIIPEGGSDELGLWGYVDALFEMENFIKEKNVEAIFCPVGSGGTYAGLFLGAKLLGLNIKICGILVTRNNEYFEEKVSTMLNKTIEKFKLSVNFDKKEFIFYDGYIGEGYAIPYKEEIDLIKKLSKKGIILDPVYTGKAFFGFINEKKNFKNPIFLHTGGIFSIFAFKEHF